MSSPDQHRRYRLPALAPASTACTAASDGSLVLAHPEPLEAHAAHLGHHLREHARNRRDSIFLGAPGVEGNIATVRYGEAASMVDRLSQGLIDLGLGPERPLAILAENSIPYALLKLAAMQVGVPVAPLSTAYARHGARDKLAFLLELLEPGAVAFDATIEPGALAVARRAVRIALPGVAGNGNGSATMAYALLERTKAGPAVATRFNSVKPDDCAKILFTSGSTGMPKGVITTHRMLVSNIVALRQLMPFVGKGPVIVDWLPWNHCFGGNYNFDLVLVNGGSYYLDPGRPVDGDFAASARLLAAVQPTLYLNVPVGYERLAARLESDSAFAERFFERLDAMFYAGSTMPEPLWRRLEAAAEKTVGQRVMLFTSYGATESSPGHTLAHWPVEGPSRIGVPMPGSTVKLVPAGDERYEIRLKGPNVTPGYLRDAERTRAIFDRDGWLVTNDGVSFADAARPERGLVFHGRLGGNFKLLSGSWVPVDEIRIAALANGAGLVRDAIVCGENRAEIGLLVFIDPQTVRRFIPDAPDFRGAATSARVRDAIASGLAAYNRGHRAGTRRIGRFLVLDEPAARYAEELTDKGYLNQTQARTSRAAQVEALYAAPTQPLVVLLD